MTDKIFCIELDFLPDKDDPLKIFESFKLMIESQILIQTELLKSSNPLANISFVLNGIEIGYRFNISSNCAKIYQNTRR